MTIMIGKKRKQTATDKQQTPQQNSENLENVVDNALNLMCQNIIDQARTVTPPPTDAEVRETLRYFVGEGAAQAWDDCVNELGLV